MLRARAKRTARLHHATVDKKARVVSALYEQEPNASAQRRSLVSVVMPCYNAAPFLRQAVDSVMQQSYDDVELVLIDDGSSDESPAIAAELARQHAERIRLLRTDRKGPYPARNAGLAYTRGEFVAFLDADDYWAPDFVARLHAALVGSASHGAVTLPD